MPASRSPFRRYRIRKTLPLLILAVCAGSPFSAWAQTPAELNLMPLPASAVAGQGELLIDGGFAAAFEGYKEPRLERARARFFTTLGRKTGILFGDQYAAVSSTLVVKTAGPSAEIEKLGEDESYRLEVSPQGATLTAATPLGAMHGLQTFLQLVHITPRGFAVPAVVIDDKPRFAWRGLMIDAGRHFMPIPVIERNLDGMEAVKLNVFHWHLSEDQGFRVESKAFPLLTAKGSDGNFYTQDQIRHILEYARDRGIRVIPEFDMPGHSTAWFAGYPELASGKGPYKIERRWGVFDPAMDPTRESTYEFLDKFIGEMTALFPDAYFHIGGDECNGKEWDRNPRIQEFMRAHKLKDNAALQAYFTARIQKLVAARGKVMEGWDEVLQPDTPKDVVIQSWRGRDSLLDAAKRGYRALLSNGYYIDLNQPASDHYLVDPLEGIADKLTPEQTANILGGEATMWSEFTTPEIVDSRIWPRTAAIAERFWSPREVRDLDSMYARLAVVQQDLAFHGLPYRAVSEQMIERIAGEPDPEPLRVLASVVQPPQGYTREGLHEYRSYTPLNRLVDAVSPESETAREFQLICGRIAAQKASPEDWQRAREWLTLWRDNDARLQPLLGRSGLASELVPVSKSLSNVAAIGLDALDALHNGHALSGATVKARAATLKAAEKPQGTLLLMPVWAVEILLAKAGSNGTQP
jgi:hexosaminidase